MVKYRLCHNKLFLFEGFCSEIQFEDIKKRFNFGNYELSILN